MGKALGSKFLIPAGVKTTCAISKQAVAQIKIFSALRETRRYNAPSVFCDGRAKSMMGRENPPQASLFYTGINLDKRVRRGGHVY